MNESPALFSAALFSSSESPLPYSQPPCSQFERVVAALFSAALFSVERVAAALFSAALFSFERVAAALFSAALFSVERSPLLYSQLPCSQWP